MNDLCKCGHTRDLHHHAKSCTGLEDLGKLKFCKCEEFREVSQSQETTGEDEMAKKKKSTKKRAVSIRGEKLYEAFSSKIESSKYAKKVADKEHKGHTPLVARVLMSFDKPVSLERVITAAKNSGYESDNVERCVRGDLAILVREGLAKATKAETNGAAPAKKRKRSTKKVSQKKMDEERELPSDGIEPPSPLPAARQMRSGNSNPLTD